MKDVITRAQENDSNAEEKLGMAYLNGYTVEQNYQLAFGWFSKAAVKGNTLAEHHLAWLYDNGIGVSKDTKLAFNWYQKAAEAGNASAELAIGLRYELGVEVKRDLVVAVKWYQKAADQKNSQAEDHLGYCLMRGLGVQKDQELGFSYLLRAAKSQPHARYVIAACYKNGIFVNCDPVEAYKWCLLALEKDREAYGLFQTLSAYLTKPQIEHARAEAASWDAQYAQ
jgi:TPR repeat protein